MSPYVSGEEAGQQGQIAAIHDAFQFLLDNLKITFPTMSGQLDGIGSSLRSRMRDMESIGERASLYGKGPRAAILRAVYRGEAAELMITSELPIKRTDTSSQEYREQLHPSQVANNFLSTVRLGDTGGYHRWSFDPKAEDLGTLYRQESIGAAFGRPALTREGVYRGRIGETNGYGNEHYTLVVRYKPEDGTRNEALVFIGSVQYSNQYLVYVPLEDTWVLTPDAEFIDIPTVNHRIVELLQEHGLLVPELTLQDAYQQVWAEAERLGLTNEPSKAVWQAPKSYDDKRSWAKPEFNYARTGSVETGGYWDILQLATRRDILNLRRYTTLNTGEATTYAHVFECETQCLRAVWDKLPLRIRHQMVAEYMTALAVAAAEMATAQLIDQPATAEAEA